MLSTDVMKMLLKSNRLFFLILCFGVTNILFAQTSSDVQLARQFYNAGEYQKSSNIYQKLYSKYKSPNYYQKLLDCHIALNEVTAAEKLIKKHKKKNIKNFTVDVDLAHILNMKGDKKKAQKKINEVFEKLEISHQYVSSVAKKFKKYGYLDQAIKAYKIGLRDPSKNSYRYQMASIYGQLDDLKQMYTTYLDLISANKGYLQNVKNIIGRTISKDPDNQNNLLLKEVLIEKAQKSDNKNIGELLIWLFIQEKNFAAAFDQEKSMDQKFNLKQKKIYELASICSKNKAFDIALECYKYIQNIGPSSNYYIDAQLSSIRVKKELLEASFDATNQDWTNLEKEYRELLTELGKTSQTILLIRDLAEIQAFRTRDVELASNTIKEVLDIAKAHPEDIAKCKLMQADIQLMKNEVWDAIISYSQVIKAYKNEVLGHEAKFRRAKVSYYQGDFEWAQAQLDVLKKSTAKLIANNAMELSLLIQDNLNLDTTTTAMKIFSNADLLLYQNKLDEAFDALDQIVINYQGHSLVDEALFKQHEIKIKQGKQEDASELLDQIITFFSYDILVDDAKFLQAQLQENYFKNKEKASELYQEIISNHQDSFYVSESRKRYRKLRGE